MRTPFGTMEAGDKIGIPLSQWEEQTGVKATNGATFPLDGGAFLRLFNVNEPPLLVNEVVGVECVAGEGQATKAARKGELLSRIDTELPTDEVEETRFDEQG